VCPTHSKFGQPQNGLDVVVLSIDYASLEIQAWYSR